MYFYRYVNFTTGVENPICGSSEDVSFLRQWAEKTFLQESGKGLCRVELCKTDSTDLSNNSGNVKICETWEN